MRMLRHKLLSFLLMVAALAQASVRSSSLDFLADASIGTGGQSLSREGIKQRVYQPQAIAADLWLSMPDSIVGYLPKDMREEMLAEKEEKSVKNKLEGNSSILSLSDDYVFVKLSDACSMKLRVLPFGEDKMICLVKTLYGPLPESEISFFVLRNDGVGNLNTLWKALPTEEFLPILTKEMFVCARPDSLEQVVYDDILHTMDMTMVSVDISEDEPVLKAELQVPFLSPEEESNLRPLLHRVMLRWTGESFVADVST